MKGYDERSTKMLQLTASVLCCSQLQREMLQQIYEIGVKDGQIQQLIGQIKNAEATCDQTQ